MIKIRILISGFISLVCCYSIVGQDKKYNEPSTYNPLVPGYFADPTIKKVGDTYYIFATTDGIRLASGEPQVWQSKDFVNWYDVEFDLPFSLSNVWAPDVLKVKNKYYYFHGNCEQGCNVYGYVADSLNGKWRSINNNNALITPATLENLPALDQHYFLDDDGSLYVFYGTWIHNFKGLGWLKIDTSDMVTVQDKGFIPNAQLPEIFEAPYVLKRNGKYIMMYSSGDCQAGTYRVQYSYADSPTGPYFPGANNPILVSNSDGSVDGPGHHSILKEKNNYYIVYHRHDNPHSGGGMFRQLCADKLIFENDTSLKKVIPTHQGMGYLAAGQITTPDIAFGAKTCATSTYHLQSNTDDYIYQSGYAVDANNGTMWRAANNQFPHSIVINLGYEKTVKRVMTQFEYATYYYQYLIECSNDSVNWQIFADQSKNRESGSPKVDDGDAMARYIKVTITGTEKTGMFAAIWNVKIYSALFDVPLLHHEVSKDGPGVQTTNSLLINLDAKSLPAGAITKAFANTGSLGGSFIPGNINTSVERIFNVKSIKFPKGSHLQLSEKSPSTLGWNSPFTVAVWVLNPDVDNGECLVVWSKRTDNLMGEYAALMYGNNPYYGAAAHWNRLDMPYSKVPEENKWNHIVLTFDGMIEKVYVNGELNTQSQRNLFIHENNTIYIGYSGEASEYFSGYIASLKMYDKYFSEDSISYLMNMDKPDIDYVDTSVKIEKTIEK